MSDPDPGSAGGGEGGWRPGLASLARRKWDAAANVGPTGHGDSRWPPVK